MNISGLGTLICFAAFIANEDEACKGRRRTSPLLGTESTGDTQSENSEESEESQPSSENGDHEVAEEVTRTSPDGLETFLFFYGEKTTYSNFCPSKFTIDGNEFTCAEHYFHYAKAVLFKDDKTAGEILKSKSPDGQKLLGRAVKDYDDDVWASAGLEVMIYAVRAKFQQNADLKARLLATDGKTLVEASPTDIKWAIGLDITNPNMVDRTKWLGKNLLGQVLMEVRDELLKVPHLKITGVKEAEVLQPINDVRMDENALTWDVWLARLAERRARKSCKEQAYLPNPPPFYSVAGFLFVEETHLSGQFDTFNLALNKWIQKGKGQYNSETGKCSEGDHYQHCVAYQRMVSKKHTHFGCAFVDCHDGHKRKHFFCEWGTNQPLPGMVVSATVLPKTIGRYHNNIRAHAVLAAAMQKVGWNVKLTILARTKARESCTGDFVHRLEDELGFDGIVLLNGDKITETEAKKYHLHVIGWGSAASNYDEVTGKCSNSERNCEAYKRAVRETVTDIACAITWCPGDYRHRDEIHLEPRDYSLVCAYTPGGEPKEGEQLGNLAYIVGEPASDCEKYGREPGTGEDAGLCVEREGHETNE